MKAGNRNHNFGVAVFHNAGDILCCTPVTRQLKADHPESRITWYTADRYRFVLENNPYIDEIVSLSGDPFALDNEIPKLKASRPWTRFFTPAPYMNYGARPGAPLFELIEAATDWKWTVPFVPVLQLTAEEKAKARAYWETLPTGRKILVETEFYSQQSHWQDDYALDLLRELKGCDPVFIFSSANKPSFLDRLAAQYPKAVWCSLPLRLNAEFFNLCEALIGVSSGVSAMTLSDHCRTDIPRIEVSRGEHWSAATYSHLTDLVVCLTRARYLEALRNLAVRLSGESPLPDFSPRFQPVAKNPVGVERIPCPDCGSLHCSPVRGDDIVQCRECSLVYLRDRMSVDALEDYYTRSYAVGCPDAAPPVRLPPSVEAIDALPEFVAAQRSELLDKAIETLGTGLAGKVLIDIGCGWGALLLNAQKRGMRVLGFEFTRPNVDYGRNVLGLDIRAERFNTADLSEGSADVVVMSHSLEHMPYPFELLEKVQFVLKPGGLLLCNVPNFGSIGSRVLKGNWPWVERTWHCIHFTPHTLRQMLVQTGFRIEQCLTCSGDLGFQIPLDILRGIHGRLPACELQGILQTHEAAGLGEEIQVVARKRGRSACRLQKEIRRMRILWVRTDAIGDNVLAMGMLPHLQARYPAAEITALCQEHVAELYEACPHLKAVIPFNRRRAYQDEEYRTSVLNRIQDLDADLCLNSVFSREPLTDYFAILSGARERIAHEGNLSNISARDRDRNNQHYTRILPHDVGLKAEQEQHRAFLRGIGVDVNHLGCHCWISPEDMRAVDRLYAEHGFVPEQTVIMFAGVQSAVRTYQHYGSALAEICRAYGLSIIALGSADDFSINQANLDASCALGINLSGKTTLRQSAALISKCRLAVGAETGLAHIACAVETPHVILLGGGHFGRFMPYSPLTSAVCLPLQCFGCDWRCAYDRPYCVQGIPPQVLGYAAAQTLERTSSGPRIFAMEGNLWPDSPDRPAWQRSDLLLKVAGAEIVPVRPADLNHPGMQQAQAAI